jgi:hypothetical protein
VGTSASKLFEANFLAVGKGVYSIKEEQHKSEVNELEEDDGVVYEDGEPDQKVIRLD